MPPFPAQALPFMQPIGKNMQLNNQKHGKHVKDASNPLSKDDELLMFFDEQFSQGLA